MDLTNASAVLGLILTVLAVASGLGSLFVVRFNSAQRQALRDEIVALRSDVEWERSERERVVQEYAERISQLEGVIETMRSEWVADMASQVAAQVVEALEAN